MAYTQIHAIKATVNKAIDYICEPHKTGDSIFISAFACAPETAAIDFKYTLDHCRENSPNQAYHLIQSFSPGEVGFEKAHAIGKELADQVLEGKYSYVLATHIDKDHVHNHIIFCAADNIDFDKYHDCKATYYRIRKLSDELCLEHNLSMIIPGQNRGQSHIEWQANKTDSSWKTTIRKDINAAIKSSSTYEEFLLLLKAKGYEIKGESFEKETSKYISFRPLDKERFVRGSAKSLGKEYTKERIQERIASGLERKSVVHSKDRSSKGLIDVNTEKFENAPGLKRWATVENLKIVSVSYNEAGSITELEHKLAVASEAHNSAKKNVVKVEKRIKELAEIIKYGEQYKATLPFYSSYKKSKNPDAYFRKYESQIILFGGAKHMLEEAGINVKTMDLKKLKLEYQELIKQRDKLAITYRTYEKKFNELNKNLKKLQKYLGQEQNNEPKITSKKQLDNIE